MDNIPYGYEDIANGQRVFDKCESYGVYTKNTKAYENVPKGYEDVADGDK